MMQKAQDITKRIKNILLKHFRLSLRTVRQMLIFYYFQVLRKLQPEMERMKIKYKKNPCFRRNKDLKETYIFETIILICNYETKD